MNKSTSVDRDTHNRADVGEVNHVETYLVLNAKERMKNPLQCPAAGSRNRGKGLPRAGSIPHLCHRRRLVAAEENMGRMATHACSEGGDTR